MIRRRLSAALLSIFLFGSQYANADLIINSLNTTTTIDFEGSLTGSNNGKFSGSGFDPGASAAGRLDSNSWKVQGLSDSGMAFGDTRISGDFARGTDANGTINGGVYAFDAGADGGTIGLGIQPSGADFTPGSFTLRLRNETGSTVRSFELGYQLRIRNDQNRSSSFNLQYSLDDSNYVDVSFFDVTSDETAASDPTWELEFDDATVVGGFSLADGDNLFFRWISNDVSGAGSRDEFHLDNINIRFDQSAVPEPSTLALLAGTFLGVFYRRARSKRHSSNKAFNQPAKNHVG